MKPDITDRAPPQLWKRLAWFAALWLSSVLSLALVAYIIRLAIRG